MADRRVTRVLLAGANPALCAPLTRQLVARGHTVVALVGDRAHAELLTRQGATPVVADVLDRDALLRAVRGHTIDAVIQESTGTAKPPVRHGGMARTDRIRVHGTANLLAAAHTSGATKFLTQSVIFGYGYRDHGTRLLTENDPFGVPQGDRCDPHLTAMLAAEQLTRGAPGGIALRYGLLYGGDAERTRSLLAKRRLPVVAGGTLGWVHHDDAATATVAALEQGRAGDVYNVVDDQPATWAEVFTEMAREYGAPPPRRLPAWLLRVVAPYVAAFAAGTSMRVSNDKAKSELGWKPAFPSFQEGIAAAARRE